MYVHAGTDPREPFTRDGWNGDRTARKTRARLLKDYQGVQVAQGLLDRKCPVTHDPLRLSRGGLRGDGGLEDALVQVGAVEIEHLEDHEDPDGCK